MNKKDNTKHAKLHGTAVEVLTALVEFYTEQQETMQETFDSRSERRQESDAGQEAQAKIESIAIKRWIARNRR